MEIDGLDIWVRKIKASGKLIIVEGKNDRKALEELGIGNIITLEGEPLFSIAESAAEISRQCIILTDLDPHGRMLYRKLKTMLSGLGVEIDNMFRESLFQLTTLQNIEGLAHHIRKAAGR